MLRYRENICVLTVFLQLHRGQKNISKVGKRVRTSGGAHHHWNSGQGPWILPYKQSSGNWQQQREGETDQ